MVRRTDECPCDVYVSCDSVCDFSGAVLLSDTGYSEESRSDMAVWDCAVGNSVLYRTYVPIVYELFRYDLVRDVLDGGATAVCVSVIHAKTMVVRVGGVSDSAVDNVHRTVDILQKAVFYINKEIENLKAGGKHECRSFLDANSRR